MIEVGQTAPDKISVLEDTDVTGKQIRQLFLLTVC